MMNPLVLPTYVLQHLAKEWRCGGCGERGVVRLVYPLVTEEQGTVRLAFPWRCGCGQFGCLSIQMPILLFGYLLARVFLLETSRRRRPKTETVVLPRESRCFLSFAQGYAETISRYINGSVHEESIDADVSNFGCLKGLSRPNALERLFFLMPRPEWDAFMKRLGFEEPPEAPPTT